MGEARLGVLQTLSSLERRTGIVRSAGLHSASTCTSFAEAVYDTMSPMLRRMNKVQVAGAFRARAGRRTYR